MLGARVLCAEHVELITPRYCGLSCSELPWTGLLQVAEQRLNECIKALLSLSKLQESAARQPAAEKRTVPGMLGAQHLRDEHFRRYGLLKLWRALQESQQQQTSGVDKSLSEASRLYESCTLKLCS